MCYNYVNNILNGDNCMKYVNIDKMHLKFKNLVSAPAPLGRMLNYILHANKVGLIYKAGYRSTDLKGNIGYSWTIDLMIGLGILTPRDIYANGTYKLVATSKGNLLYRFIENKPVGYFSEKTDLGTILAIKGQLGNNAKAFTNAFEAIFRASPLYINLCIYLRDHPKTIDKKEFYKNYFMELSNAYNRKGTTNNAGFNRLTSLIQICAFLGYVSIDNNIIHFDLRKFK